MAAENKDHWSSEAYNSSASFVPLLTSKVQEYLAPAPTDRVLDVGCGDGVLTQRIAGQVPQGSVLGLDFSPAMIATASKSYPASNLEYRVQDCSRLASGLDVNSRFDKVFSNAALHWILRAPESREHVLVDCFDALKPGGKFVFEMGGKGNVGEVHAALVCGLIAAGVEAESAREAVPWFFPSNEWMKTALEKVGFRVELIEREYRPTELNPESGQGGGLKGWVRLMCAPALEKVTEHRREEVVGLVAESLKGVITREENGGQWIGYVRLRAVASKP